MRKILLSIFTMLTFSVSGNINFIKFDSIPETEKYYDKFVYIKDNEPFINHWTPNWNYNVSKESLINGLKDCFDAYSKCDTNNVELDLLLGDICHYLYNLNENNYYETAIGYYKKAIDLAPNDYRPLWFLANHYALSNAQDKSVVYFLESQKRLPSIAPSAFWEAYCFATYSANMPSHCIYAMDKARSILGEPGNFETQLGQVTQNRIEPVKSDTTYNYKDIWSFSKDSMSTFICRPFGIKLSIAPEWKIRLSDYKNNGGFIIIDPPGITNKEGRLITYTIAIFIKIAQSDDSLDNFIGKFVSNYPDKKAVTIYPKYPGLLSYEYIDKGMYKEIGGAHMNIIGLTRNEPEYPGLLLEQPISAPQGEVGKVQYYRAVNMKGRFKSRIYYAFMLDACEDIYDEAFTIFKDVFEKQIVIE